MYIWCECENETENRDGTPLPLSSRTERIENEKKTTFKIYKAKFYGQNKKRSNVSRLDYLLSNDGRGSIVNKEIKEKRQFSDPNVRFYIPFGFFLCFLYMYVRTYIYVLCVLFDFLQLIFFCFWLRCIRNEYY